MVKQKNWLAVFNLCLKKLGFKTLFAIQKKLKTNLNFNVFNRFNFMNYIISSGNQEDGVKQNAFTH